MSELSVRHSAVGAAVLKGATGFRIAHKENNSELSHADHLTIMNQLSQRQPGQSPRAKKMLAAYADALRTGGIHYGK